jgi:hypothetical protein
MQQAKSYYEGAGWHVDDVPASQFVVANIISSRAYLCLQMTARNRESVNNRAFPPPTGDL